MVGVCHGQAGSRAFLWDSVGGMKDLGVLQGDTASRALSITEHGQVVGFSRNAYGTKAFLWDTTNGMRDLNTLLGDACRDAAGRIVDARSASNDDNGATLIAARRQGGSCILECGRDAVQVSRSDE